jgi:transposase
MAKRYRPVERDQAFLLPPDMRDWLPAGHPVHLVIRVVEEHLDTSAFHALRRTGGAGTAGYDPDMLVTVLVWAYAHQVTSSRRIEALCGTDVAFRLICAGNLPDHATIARFRAAFPGPAAELFAQVLALCARLGMGKLGVVALDGTKIAAHASKSANRTEDRLRQLAAGTVAAHAAADAAEDVLFGPDARGDEVPEDAWRPRRRDERIAAALASLAREREAAEAERKKTEDEHLADAAAGRPRPGHRPAGADVALAEMTLQRAIAAQQARIQRWEERNAASLAGAGPAPHGPRPVPPGQYVRVRAAQAKLEAARARQAAAARKAGEKRRSLAGPGPVRNITDPHSRLMPVRGGGFIQGYNAQVVTSADGLIIATRLTDTTTDMHWLEPMLAAAEDAAALITAHRPAGTGDHHDSNSSSSSSDHHDSSSGSSSSGDDDDDPGASADLSAASASGPGSTSPAAAYAGPIGLLLADAGYCSEDNLKAAGPDRLIATGKLRDVEKAARGDARGDPRQAGQATRAMAARLQTADGIAAYRQRGHIAETPNGDIKHNKGYRQSCMRGLPKASAEWELITATVNLFKAITSRHLTHHALDTLTRPATSQPAPA